MSFSWDSVIRWLVTTQATIVVCGGIVSAALAWWAYGLWRFWQARRTLKTAVDALDQLNSERDFTAAYEELNEKFSQHPLLGHAWREFVDTLILPATPSDVCRNSEAPELFFNGESVAGGKVNLRLLHAMPNYLTGLES